MNRLLCVPITVISLTLVGCGKKTAEDPPSNTSAAVVPVDVAKVRQGEVEVTVSAVGQTEALRKESVLSPAAGTVTRVNAREGLSVLKGDTLALARSKESQAAIVGAKTLLAAATSPEQKADAQRALQLAESSQSLFAITASSAGIVESRSVLEGSLVSEGNELFSIIDPSSIGFVAQVPIAALTSVKIGQAASVTLTAADQSMQTAVVSAISPATDPLTQTVRVRLELQGLSSEQRVYLKEGISGTARIVTGTRTNVFLVPKAALLRNDVNDTYTVVTITADSLSRAIPVTVGVITDSTAEISGGVVSAGMPVIIAGHYALADSTRVTVSARPSR